MECLLHIRQQILRAALFSPIHTKRKQLRVLVVMSLVGIMLSKIRQTKTNTAWYHLQCNLFLIFKLAANYFTILWWFFAIYWHESATGVHVSHHPEPRSNSLPTPPLWVVPEHQLWVPCFMHCINLHWSTILHMIRYMFQCYSLISSHPHLLPQSPKVCSLHLCLFCCLACRVIVTIFLNSIYMH